MNYRHAYHAGNLADIFKHLTLAHLLVQLRDKDTPFCVIDTHAGAGSYDLRGTEALKTCEAQSGAFAFAKLEPDAALAPLQEVLAKWNLGISFGKDFQEKQLRFYPGSPAIIQHYARANDRLLAVEKHPEENKKLRKMLSPYFNAQIHQRDAWEAMGALIPPPEKRALVFIDPPYEQPDEMEKAFTAISKAYERMAHAVFALWYPVVDDIAVASLKEKFASSGIPKILCLEAEFSPRKTLRGCGLILINPPWKMGEKLSEALNLLQPLFAESSAPAELSWLKP
ncbi:MAG: 23S rRNA (adenine(2030)-N(6))-methyltransferase RlmJ [Proteobacteria bacterium]|nr:23S rRNA (adenine(2030)-N(6))-methyltransferase RlmJ [Pseudomonadota bacterium]